MGIFEGDFLFFALFSLLWGLQALIVFLKPKWLYEICVSSFEKNEQYVLSLDYSLGLWPKDENDFWLRQKINLFLASGVAIFLFFVLTFEY